MRGKVNRRKYLQGDNRERFSPFQSYYAAVLQVTSHLFKAMAVLRSLNMSVALFALGWTFEKLLPGEDFLQREVYFWKKFSSYLHFHGPAKLPFSTNFCQGISFDKKSGEALFNLGMQQYQPSGQACCTDRRSENSCVSLCLDEGVQRNGACLSVVSTSASHSKLFHRVFICDFSSSKGNPIKLKISTSLKIEDQHQNARFRIYFVLEDKTSVEGKTEVSMKSRPKGYRSCVRIGKLLVSGSLIDFTAEEQSEAAKIKVLENSAVVEGDELTPWQEVHFLLELKDYESLTEILLLPTTEAPVLWGFLQIEEYNGFEDISQKAEKNPVILQEKFDKNPVVLQEKADNNSVFRQNSQIIIIS